MKKNSKIYIAGHKGLVGSNIKKALEKSGFTNLITKTRQELDLLRQIEVEQFFESERPDYVFLAAARVGGIKANMTYPAKFLYENLQIQNNIIWSSYKKGVKKLLSLGSSCIYPRDCPQPIKEEYLLTGKLEPTNEGYALAKIAGIKLCEKMHQEFGTNFISCMPTNLYGPNDNFDLESSHVLPAMIRKFHEAKMRGDNDITLWGTGAPRREFLHVDDLADACVFLMNNYDSPKIINIGTGEDIMIKELAEMIKNVVGFKGGISWNTSIPDGTPRKLLNVSKLKAFGWKYKIGLEDGIKRTYEWFLANSRL